MTGISLKHVLSLVGRLDDAPGDDAPRQRFRRFLRQSVTDIDQLSAYLAEAGGGDTEQDDRAFQDLINHLGGLLGFRVSFGPYRPSEQELSFHGHWQSDDGSHIVIEARAREAELTTSSLVGSIYGLIAENRIRNWEAASGLYVLARDADRGGLERAIIADRQTERLRIATVDALVRLARCVQQGPLEHSDVRLVLGPSRPDVGPTVDLIARRRTPGGDMPGEGRPDRRPDGARPDESPRHVGADRGRPPSRLVDYVDDVVDQLIEALRPDQI